MHMLMSLFALISLALVAGGAFLFWQRLSAFQSQETNQDLMKEILNTKPSKQLPK
jgi:Na+-translocating ferredoxin:NAD+ oxidoreductase RnfG subunit